MSRIAIVGGGALGLAYASHLCRVADVLVIDRNPETVAAAHAGRLSVVLRDHEAREPLPVRFRVTDRWEELPPDWMLVCVKTTSTRDVARSIARAWPGAAGVVVSVQNGLGNVAALERELGHERVRAGISHVGARRLAPGVVEIGRVGSTIVERRSDDDAAVSLACVMRASGLDVELEGDVDRLIWNKLIIAVGCSAIAALCRLKLGAFADLHGGALGSLVRAAMAECAAIMEHEGIELAGDPLARLERLAASAPGNRPSMLEDLLRGQATEVDAINGAVVREAERCGLAAPINATLWRLVKAIEEAPGERVPPAAAAAAPE